MENQEAVSASPRHWLVEGSTEEICRRIGALSLAAARLSDSQEVYDGQEFRALDAELALRGFPRELEVDIFDVGEGQKEEQTTYRLELARRRWLCSSTDAIQYPLVGDWRVVVGPCSMLSGEICAPERVVIVGYDDSRSLEACSAVPRGLDVLLGFAVELEGLGVDVTDALGVAVDDIRKLSEAQ